MRPRPRFRIIRAALDSGSRSLPSPQVVKQVKFSPKTPNLTIELDEAEIGRIANALLDADLEGFEDSAPESP